MLGVGKGGLLDSWFERWARVRQVYLRWEGFDLCCMIKVQALSIMATGAYTLSITNNSRLL